LGIQVKRVSDIPRQEDGSRVLIDRYWPRGIQASSGAVTTWIRELSPSAESVAWFGHKPERWEEFKQRYWAELDRPEKAAWLEQVQRDSETGTVTLVYGARHAQHNPARAMEEYLTQRGVMPVDQPIPVPAARADSTPPFRSPCWPARSTLQWITLGISIFLPLSGLLIIQVGFTYGATAWLIFLTLLTAFSVLTTVRLHRRELFLAALNDAIPRNPAERESRWVVVRALVVSVIQTTTAFIVIAMLFLFLAAAASRVA